MASWYDELDDRLMRFIANQHMFFVATAPADGRVNVSPKGLDSLRVLSPTRVAWLNGTGSGNESAAHVLENGRMTIMFCSYVREPLILRLYGTARVLYDTDPDWADLLAEFPPMRGARNIFDMTIESIQTACGYGVPEYTFTSQRTMMDTWAQKKGPDGIASYQQQKNAASIDGLPTGLPPV